MQATKVKLSQKEAEGIAEKRAGRRSIVQFSHAKSYLWQPASLRVSFLFCILPNEGISLSLQSFLHPKEILTLSLSPVSLTSSLTLLHILTLTIAGKCLGIWPHRADMRYSSTIYTASPIMEGEHAVLNKADTTCIIQAAHASA